MDFEMIHDTCMTLHKSVTDNTQEYKSSIQTIIQELVLLELPSYL